MLQRGNVALGLGIGVLVLVLEVALAIVHRTRPERQPIIDTIEGVVELEDESDIPNARWFVGEQRVHLPPHWHDGLAPGVGARVRVARPPGESIAFALAIDGYRSVDFERAQGLPTAPPARPVTILLLVTATLLAVPGLLIGAVTFGFGTARPSDGFSALKALAEDAREGTTATFDQDLPPQGRVRITDATILPRALLTEAPEHAGWAVLSATGTTRLRTEFETRFGRKVGGIPKPDETTEPVSLEPADVLVWRRVDTHEQSGPTGRPGNQVMVWLARDKPFEAVRFDGEPVLRAPANAENLASAAGFLLLGLLALPVLVLTGITIGRRRAAEARFLERVSETYKPNVSGH